MKNKFKGRPLSWSSISLFEWDRELWAKKYLEGIKEPETQEMTFGKLVADSFQTKNPLAPVSLYPVIEKKLEVVFSGIPLIGFIDTYDPITHNFREFKTSKTLWTSKKAQEHGQLRMYALMLYITYKIPPEQYSIHLDCIQTKSNGDFSIDFVKPLTIVSHEVELTMKDIIDFGVYIKKIYKEMIEYV